LFETGKTKRYNSALSMKAKILVGILTIVTVSVPCGGLRKKRSQLLLKSWAKKKNYSWKTTLDFGNFSTTTEGKVNQEGLACLSMTAGDNTREAFLKGGRLS
jgi:hypothetical protein